MAEPPILFPTSPYCRVHARVASIWADGPDDGTHPDWRPAVGEKVTLAPSISSQLLVYDAAGPNPIIVTVERVECVVDEDGWLTKSDGRPVFIAPTDDPLLSVTGWTWTATIKGKSVVFSAPTGGVVDLAMFIAAPATDNTKTWIERIPELLDAAEDVSVEIAVAAGAGDAAVTAAGQAAGSATDAADSASAAATSATAAAQSATAAATSAQGAETARDAASAFATDADNDRIAAVEARTGAETARDETIQVASSIAITADATDVDPGTPADVNVTGEAPQYHFGFEVPRGRDTFVASATPPADTEMLWLDTSTPSLPESGSPFELRGYGMPNGVVTASPGTYYTDNVGTNGAWRWLKTSGTGNTGWTVVFGDTGWRDITAYFTVANGTVAIRRVVNDVIWRADNLKISAGGSFVTPAGFRISFTGYWNDYLGAMNRDGGATPIAWARRAQGNTIFPQVTSPASLYGYSYDSVRDAWPTELPGTAV